MTDMVKKYVPYAVIILLVYMLLPLVFIPAQCRSFHPLHMTLCSRLQQSAVRHTTAQNTDLTFSLLSLRRLFIFRVCSSTTADFLQAHFQQTLFSSQFILLRIFGLFLGDLAFGDKRRQKEKAEQEEAEEMLLEAKRREKEELENMTSSSKKSERKAPYRQERRYARRPSPAPQKTETADDDDFDYDKYLSVLTESKIRTKAKLTIS